MTICGLVFLAMAGITVLRIARGYPILSDPRMLLKHLEGFGVLFVAYGYICVLSVVAGLVICTLAHAARKGLRSLRRR